MTQALQTDSTATSVTLRDVTKSYGTNVVLSGINLDIAGGEFISLLGPSGCGKTTALRILSGLEQADAGEILVGNENVSLVPPNKRDIGMVFQAYSLFPHLTVLQNTSFGLRRRGVNKKAAAERATESLELVGLGHLADRYAHQLSGGQQQRVALARALVTEPKMLLLDEPLSALDAKVRVQLREEIRRIQLELGITTVFVTHDQEEALAISDRIAVMNSGRIEQLGTPQELYLNPASAYVAAFVGLSSVYATTVSGGQALIGADRVPLLNPHADGPAEVLIRPENVRFSQQPEALPATVQESIFLGSIRRTRLDVAGQSLWVQHSAFDSHLIGEQVRVTVEPVPVAARPAE